MRALAGPAALAVLLASCTAPPVQPDALAPPPALCRIGPDGGRPVADRGIGGTGAPVRIADRGIGGTGIVAVITGFASICLGGVEVAVDNATPATVDDAPAAIAGLRAGQLAVVTAAGPAGTLAARSVAIRHEVVGPVTHAEPGLLVVAGQRVAVGQAVAGFTDPAPGDWVAISGLRRPDGIIVATRIDHAPAGPVLVHGELVRAGGAALIGGMAVQLPDGNATPAGWQVTAAGRLAEGAMVIDAITRDRLADSPATLFGPDVQAFVVEAYRPAFADGLFATGSGADGGLGASERGISTFRRQPDGSIGSAAFRPAGTNGPDGRAFSPAPTSRLGNEGGSRSGAGAGEPGSRRRDGSNSGAGQGGGQGAGQGGGPGSPSPGGDGRSGPGRR